MSLVSGLLQRGLLALCLSGTTGCSYLFVQGPPPMPPLGQPQPHAISCTSSRVAPGFDTAFTALEMLRIGIDLGESNSAFNGAVISRGADIGLGAAFTALFLSSAIYGFVRTNDCDQAMAAAAALNTPPPPPNVVPPGTSATPPAPTAPPSTSAAPPTASAAPSAVPAPASAPAPSGSATP